MKLITIVGDSLSMVRPWDGILYKDTYVYKLQELLNNNYIIIHYSERANNILLEYNRVVGQDGMLYSQPDIIIIHLGIVDCAPRLFSQQKHQILNFLSSLTIFNSITSFYMQFKSKHRRFFTKNFPKTYVPIEIFKDKFEYLINEIRKNTNAKVLIINIADTNKINKARSYGFEKNILEYNQILEDLVNDNKDICSLINFFELTNLNKHLILEDGIHLSKMGHEILAKILFKKIIC
ncbi:SGNH/GDSL hydrolase family protein [Methanobacterium sp.]|uniref:SGNH/GDSL hydrolase family protein n=1 Tax=Methanobacterium sp. TaxID=2164 RepID=UPI002ABA599A|nr:SGNH/GDSL hydrolase family protein [Methanobacterium sp.]MDY9922949.1 SGNH/GDSL hydrolase family protein [Methanobacterium sp.]